MRTWFNLTTAADSKVTERILKALFKFVFVKMTQVKTEICDKFDFFWIMAIKYTEKVYYLNFLEYTTSTGSNEFQKFWSKVAKLSIKVTNMMSIEAAIRGVLWKKVFLKISQNSQENTCARASFLIKLVFSCEFCEIFKNTFFTEHLWTNPFRSSSFHSFNVAGNKEFLKKSSFTLVCRMLWEFLVLQELFDVGIVLKR